MKKTHARLREVLRYVGPKKNPSKFPFIMSNVIWELMKTQTKINKLEGKMDKLMHKVTEKMKVAEKDIKRGKKSAAVKVLKKAEKKNEKLVKEDKNVRDPIIHKVEKLTKKHKLPKNWGMINGEKF